MSILLDNTGGAQHFLMGNDAIVRGALEAGVNYASGYPGTPSSEVIEQLAKVAGERNIYVEWSTNEKVALESAAAASFSNLRALCAMKQVGVNVASDFLLHMSLSGTRGGMVLISCDDPGALSSNNEGPSRHYSKMFEFPLLEPGDFQEAKEMTKWAFELSEEIKNVVMVRSVTRISHASGIVKLGALPPTPDPKACYVYDGPENDLDTHPVITQPIKTTHPRQQRKLQQAAKLFDECPFNTYEGPQDPELLIITSSACNLYSKEAVSLIGASDKVGVLKLGTTWPLPPKILVKYLKKTEKVMIVEEVLPFMEENVKSFASEKLEEIGGKKFFGKNDGTLPPVGEMNVDIVAEAICRVLNLTFSPGVESGYSDKFKSTAMVSIPDRGVTFCPGCPHRASFWMLHNTTLLDNRKGFVCGDIGCYALGRHACGYFTSKTFHAMGSGAGLASGFGKLSRFGMDQPAIAICGDSTFFHSVIPPLINAVHNDSDMTLVVLDNRGTAMTGFQSHPGSDYNAMGESAPWIEIEKVCEAIGATVAVEDPFDMERAQEKLLEFVSDTKGVKVLILRQACALSPQKRNKKKYAVHIDEDLCLGENCGCNRLCSRTFLCPGIIWDRDAKKPKIDEVLCAGCGVCTQICPQGAIQKTEVM